ncbi:hypothetical protein OG897_28355 [Streptomyces sp. NBC_00237]|uniref:hypothetical protein n=1 Tax=Streptomyces sp. NBC_00237 TaxID=2975687 RepID=UPI002258482D|nr:hypothetical protein [Streptomyces sp. NBC_00237]MCX5205358.1 hypothetical protein [Streptomyces sp. NBC_00237]
MSRTTWVVASICLPVLLHAPSPFPTVEFVHHSAAVRRRRAGTGPGRADRPAWQSPYGPPSRRSHRGRWSPAPTSVTGVSLTVVRNGYLCGRCD